MTHFLAIVRHNCFTDMTLPVIVLLSPAPLVSEDFTVFGSSLYKFVILGSTVYNLCFTGINTETLRPKFISRLVPLSHKECVEKQDMGS